MSKLVKVHDNSKVTDGIAQLVDDLINYSAPVDIRNRILYVYLQYIIHKFEELPMDFQEIALDFNFLIDFFNRIDTELKTEQLLESEQE